MDRRALHKQFLQQFPIERLGDMTLEEYTNLDREDSFCYWLEVKTQELGSIWGGSSYKFGIYRYEKKPNNPSVIISDEEYAWYKKYAVLDRFEAFKVVLKTIVDIAESASKGNFEVIEEDDTFGTVVKWKIAFLYANETLLPFYKRDMLENLASEFGYSNPSKAKIYELQRFLMSQKGDKDFYDFCDELVDIIKKAQSNKKRYWLYAPGENASKWERCQEQGIICIGWDELDDLSNLESIEEAKKRLREAYDKPEATFMNDGRAIWEFSKEIQIGDVIFTKSGVTKIIGRGVVKSDYIYDPEQEEYRHIRKVEWTHVGEWPVEKLPLKTLTDISENKYPGYAKKLEEMITEGITFAEQSTQCNKSLLHNTNLLLKNKNLILNGAPGTGKTFLAKQIAAQIIFEGNIPDNFEEHPIFIEQCGFVQFHPSYDYTDFVEGLRPTRPNKDGNIGFERKDGIFKKFCRNALIKVFVEPKKTISIKFKDEDIEISKAMDWLMKQNGRTIKSIRSNTEYTLVIKQEKIFLRIPKGSDNYVSPEGIKRYLRTKEYNKDHQTYEPSVGNFIIENCPLYTNEDLISLQNNSNFLSETNSEKDDRPYIFIIDEINRGEISKIFGELFFSIDPGYRGVKGKVQTQYQNLITEDDPFKDGFYIPENVYIIGTMNDIDRSVECMDFAMRRRFTFKEITAEESGINMGLSSEATKRMQSLNNAISEIEGFNSSFHIGAAYYLGVTDYNELWELKLQGLLKEYLRGMPDAEETLETLKKAYELSSQDDNN